MPDRPLLVTGDADLLEHLVRLAAAAGVETEVAQDVDAARRAWASAPVVLVGADLVGAVAGAGLPRRASVLVADWSREDNGVWQAAAAAGAEAVHPLPGADDLLVRRLAESRRPSTGRVLAVAGGRGGAGASTLACALARTAARSAPALLVDADPLGGGLDLAMGVEAAAGLRWPHLVGAEGRTDPHELTAALPAVDGVSVLSWHRGDPTDLPPAAMESVLGAARTAVRALGGGPAPSPGPGGPVRLLRSPTSCCWSCRPRSGPPRPPGRSRPGSRPAPPTCGSWSAGPHPAG